MCFIRGDDYILPNERVQAVRFNRTSHKTLLHVFLRVHKQREIIGSPEFEQQLQAHLKIPSSLE